MDSNYIKDLRQLNQHLQDAFHREKFLEYKLNALQRIVEKTHRTSEVGWRALIEEDRLITRCAVLNKQLEIYQNQYSEDQFVEELQKLRDEKVQFEENARLFISQVTEEKLYAVRRIYELESTLRSAAREYIHLKEMRENSQEELSEFSQKYSRHFKRAEDLAYKLTQAEERQRETRLLLEQENKSLSTQLEKQTKIVNGLQDQIYSLVHENGQNRDSNICDSKREYSDIGTMTEKGISLYSEPDLVGDTIPTKLDSGSVDDQRDRVECLHNKSSQSDDEIKECRKRVEELNLCIKEPQLGDCSSTEMSHQLEERLRALEDRLSKLQQRSYKTSRIEAPGSNDIASLRNEITKLEELIAEENGGKTEHRLVELREEMKKIRIQIAESSNEENKLKEKIGNVREMLSKNLKNAAEINEKIQKLTEINSDLKNQLNEAQNELREETARSDSLSSNTESLRQQFAECEESMKDSAKETASLKDKLEQFQRAKEYGKTLQDVDKLKKQCTSLQEETAHLRLEHWELLQRSSELSKFKIVESMDKTYVSEQTKSELNDIAEKCERYNKVLSAMEEELREAKKRYKICVTEKDEVSSKLNALREQYTSLKHIYSVPIVYVLPLLMAIAMLLVYLP